MFGLQAPNLSVVPITEGVLRRFQARHRGGGEGKALRIGFSRVTQAFYQQPQAVAIVAGIGQCPAQLPLLALQVFIQAVFGDALRAAAKAARPGVQKRGKADELRMGEQLTVAGLKFALAHVGLPIEAMSRQFGDQHLEIAQRRREPAQFGGGPIEPGCAGQPRNGRSRLRMRRRQTRKSCSASLSCACCSRNSASFSAGSSRRSWVTISATKAICRAWKG